MSARIRHTAFLLLAACAAPGGPDAPAGALPIVRVMTYNIRAGHGMDGVLDLDRIASVIRRADPDLVGLQEVDVGTVRSGGLDLAAELARRTGLEAAFGANLEFQGGHYGNALLSRWPVLRTANHRLPVIDDGEQRGVLDVVVRAPVPGGELRVLVTHLDHRRDERERLASAAAIDELIRDDGPPSLLLADLNAEPGSASLAAFGRRWTIADPGAGEPTFPADVPVRRIDYVLYRPADAWRVRSVTVLPEAVASDHRPVLVLLEATGRPGR